MDEAAKLSDRLIYSAVHRCPCGYGYAYDKAGKIFTESNSPFVMRPDQWECAGTLLYRAGELPNGERDRVLTAMHERPICFSIGIKGENDQYSTREPIIPSNQP